MKFERNLVLFLFCQLFAVCTLLHAQDRMNINLIAHWDSDSIPHHPQTKVKFSDVWGYAQDNREYALLTSTQGIHVFEIMDKHFRFIDFVEATYSSVTVTNRDVTTYKNYAYTVCDHGPSNLQIIDLSYLPDSVHLVATIDSLFGRGHNLFVDEENALLYACRITTIVNGNATVVTPMRVFSLADPLNPTLLYEGPNGIVEVHDIWVQNNIAILNCGYDGIRVYDFSNPSNPILKQNLTFYQQQGYNHQGAMTPDGTRYVFGDETNGKMLKLCEVQPNHQLVVKHYFGTNSQNGSIPHNIMCTNDFAYVAYYNEGLRIFDLKRKPGREVAHYDTYPEYNDFKMKGAWGIYSQLPSKRILISDIQNGLFLFDFDESQFLIDVEEISIYPTLQEQGGMITVQLEKGKATEFEVIVHNTMGEVITKKVVEYKSYDQIELKASPGVYFVTVKYIDYLNEEQTVTQKILVY